MVAEATSVAAAAPAEFRRAWRPAVASGVGVMLGISSIPAFCLGVFALPMTREFGWSLAAYQAGTLMFTVGIFLSSAIVGALCDRHGARRVVLVGLPAMSVGVATLGLVQAPVWTFYAAMLAAALLGSGTLPTTWTRMINGLFSRSRGVALGLVLSGSGLFAAFGPQLATVLIEAVGWRAAWFAIAALPTVVAWPIVIAWFRGSAVQKPPAAGAAADGLQVAEWGVTLPAALRGHRFWVMALGFGLITGAAAGTNVNLVPLLVSKQFTPLEAAQLFGVMGVAIAAGRLLTGFVIDRLWAPGVAAVVLSLPALGILLLGGDAVSVRSAVVAIAILGFAQGAEYDFLAYLVARYFGLAHYGRIYGLMILPMTLFTAVGAIGVGAVKDVTGSFDAALPALAALFAVGGLAQATLGRYPSESRAAH